MITDLFLAPFLALFGWIVDLLPEYQLPAPESSGLVVWLARVDSFIPIASAVTAAVVLLGMVGVFLTWRLVLVVRHVLLP